MKKTIRSSCLATLVVPAPGNQLDVLGLERRLGILRLDGERGLLLAKEKHLHLRARFERGGGGRTSTYIEAMGGARPTPLYFEA